jgi:hypothetical protein
VGKASLAIAILLVGCGANPGSDEAGAGLSHADDFAAKMPSHLVIMDTMAWFGIPSSGDPSWGTWQLPPFRCVPARDPATCDDTGNRSIASRYHPLAGIYSSSGRDAESLRRIDLMLSNLRSPTDASARIDAYAIQLDGTHFTSLHGAPAPSAEIAYQALEHFLTEADALGRANAVVPMDDATWYWNNGHWLGLDCAASRATCLDYLRQDVIDLITLAAPHASALRVDGKLVLHFYLDAAAQFPSAAEWSAIFAAARAATGHDFYTIGTHALPGWFDAFDALAPWVDPGYAWPHTSGPSVYEHARAYAALQHDPLLAAVPPGRVVFGGVAPGFDDFTMGWGACVQRQIPRDLDLLRGTIDYLASQSIKGVMLTTWDDWTEGSFFEPSVEEGTSKLVTLRQKLADLYGEPQDPTGDAALDARWRSYPPSNACCAPAAVLEPTPNQSVGPSIHLRVAGPPCLGAMIAYIDSVEVARAQTSAIDQWVGVTLGAHTLHINAWEPDGTLHMSTDVSFSRTY